MNAPVDFAGESFTPGTDVRGTYQINSYRFTYRSLFAPRARLSFDLDGIAGGPGRAFDVVLKAGYDVTPRWRVSGGYRTVEGGANVPSVFAFAWRHAGVLGVRYAL